MSFELADIQRAVNAKLKDEGQFLTPSDVDECILSALNILNVDAPNMIPVDIAGVDGSKNYAIGTSFVKGYSAPRKLEFIEAATTDDDVPLFLRKTDDWFIYEDPTKAVGAQMRLRLKVTQPSTGDTLRLTLTTPFVLLPASTIENQRDGQALSAKALQLCFEALAARFTQTTDPTIDADAVDYGGAPDRFLLLARDWRNIYNHLAGLDENIKAAMALKEIDLRLSTGERTLWHDETRR
jgi:hypothetical protein